MAPLRPAPGPPAIKPYHAHPPFRFAGPAHVFTENLCATRKMRKSRRGVKLRNSETQKLRNFSEHTLGGCGAIRRTPIVDTVWPPPEPCLLVGNDNKVQVRAPPSSLPRPAPPCCALRRASCAVPEWSKAVESAPLEAASSSTLGSGWALSGLGSPWEYRAAQSRQVCPEEAHEPKLGRCPAGTLTMLQCLGRGVAL